MNTNLLAQSIDQTGAFAWILTLLPFLLVPLIIFAVVKMTNVLLYNEHSKTTLTINSLIVTVVTTLSISGFLWIYNMSFDYFVSDSFQFKSQILNQTQVLSQLFFIAAISSTIIFIVLFIFKLTAKLLNTFKIGSLLVHLFDLALGLFTLALLLGFSFWMISFAAQIVMETNSESILYGLRAILENDPDKGFLLGTYINIGKFSISGVQIIVGSILGTAIFFSVLGNTILSYNKNNVEKAETIYKSISYVAYMLLATIVLLILISEETIYISLHIFWLWSLLNGWVGTIIIWATALTLASSVLMIYQSHFIIFLYDAYKGEKGIPYYSTVVAEVVAISTVLLLMAWITLPSLGSKAIPVLVILLAIEMLLIIGTAIMSKKSDNFDRTAYMTAILFPRISMYIKAGAIAIILFLIMSIAALVITAFILTMMFLFYLIASCFK